MSSYIFVSPRSDPGMGRPLDAPILRAGVRPTMGTCRPDLRRLVRLGDVSVANGDGVIRPASSAASRASRVSAAKRMPSICSARRRSARVTTRDAAAATRA